MKVIFYGTTDFAVASLDQLINSGIDVAAVVTAPNKMGGRGRKEIISSEVYKYSLEKGLNIIQPTNLKGPKFLEKIKIINADLFVVVAFRMMPEVLWNMPIMGTINLHGSLLPAYRGAAPINWAIINGEKTTGITIFYLDRKIDTGKIIHQKEVDILPEENFGQLYERLKGIGAEELSNTVKLINVGPMDGIPQKEEHASHAPKLDKDNTEINFIATPKMLVDLCRGLCPYPTAWFLFDGLKMKVFRCTAHDDNIKPGVWKSDYKSYLRLGCKNGSIELNDIQIEGKKRMDIREFLNGYGHKLKKIKEQD